MESGGTPHSGQQNFWRDLAGLPNLLSVSRIVGTIIAVALYLQGYRKAGLWVGALAGFTDFLDGWLARRLNLSTDVGALLDRLSDLVLEALALTTCLFFGLVPPSFLGLYLVREWIVITARLYVAEQGETIPSSFFGKRKTNLILVSFLALFASHAGAVPTEIGETVYRAGFGLMVAGLVASYISGVEYVAAFIRIYNRQRSR